MVFYKEGTLLVKQEENYSEVSKERLWLILDLVDCKLVVANVYLADSVASSTSFVAWNKYS